MVRRRGVIYDFPNLLVMSFYVGKGDMLGAAATSCRKGRRPIRKEQVNAEGRINF